jgi:hypothetical protein
MPNVIYRVQVSGVEQARAAIASVPGTAAAATETLSVRTNRLADSFKMVSRDIGTLGGAASQTFTHMADEALSIVGVITGGGGLVAAISVAGIVIGRLAEAWKDYETSERAAAKFSTEWLTKHNKQLEEALVLQRKTTASLSGETRASAEEKILATTTKINELKTQIAKTEADSAYRVGKDKEDREKKLLDLTSQLYLFETDRNQAIQARQLILDENSRRMREEYEIAKNVAAEMRHIQAANEAIERKVANLAAEGGWVAKAFFGNEAKAKKLSDFLDADAMEDELDRVIAFSKDPLALMDEEDRKKKIGFYKALGDGALEAAEKQKALAREVMSVSYAMQAIRNVGAPAFAAGMLVVDSAMGVANKYLDEFGKINRDNWKDLLTFSKDKQAALAAEAQAALWSLARQAAPKAIFENAEGIASAAAAAGEYGKGNIPGGVLLTAAAVGHYAASAAYGTIAVAAGGASLGIGAMRGSGGMFSASSSGGGAPSASGGSGGGGSPGGGSPSRGRSGGSGESGGGSVNITYVYEAGSINANDERATARTVTRAVGNARGSWHERRLLERRT